MEITRVKCDSMSITSTITPETIVFNHYPGSSSDPQLHVHIIEGISGRSIFLTERDARVIKEFMNKHYPD